jgi:predicted aspartyl protease
LGRKLTPFGEISDPKIPVAVHTIRGDVEFRFLIDTGADFAVAPRSLAAVVGLDWTRLLPTTAVGVGQGNVHARVGPLPVKIGSAELTVRCLFMDAPSTMFILGRADFLDTFVLEIDARQHSILLTEIR